MPSLMIFDAKDSSHHFPACKNPKRRSIRFRKDTKCKVAGGIARASHKRMRRRWGMLQKKHQIEA